MLCPHPLTAVGMAACGPDTVSGASVCYNTTTQCCENAATARVGQTINGGCYAKPYCDMQYKSGALSISIVGELAGG